MKSEHVEASFSPDTQEDRLNRMFWSDEDAKIVGDLIKLGKSVQLPTKSLKPLSDSTDFDEGDTELLITTARKTVGETSQYTPSPTTPMEGERDPRDEYRFTVALRSKVLPNIVMRALRKSGIWSADESRNIKSVPSFRSSPEKSNFSQDEFSGQAVIDKGFLPYSEGGPETITSIFAPQFAEDRDLSDRRVRKSLGHEIQHIIRALTNKHLWKGFENEARAVGLKEAKPEVGGFKVASNMQGSESNGELFAQIISIRQDTGNEPSIRDIIPGVREKIDNNLKKADKGGKINPRYLSANIALLHHLEQLDRLGYGEVPAIRLSALSTFGYSSLEKMPDMIRAGIMTGEKFEKINYVVQSVESWLVSPSTEGFKLS